LKNLKVFSSLCGTDAAKRVALVTTMWNQVPASAQAQMATREKELEGEFWSHLVAAGVLIRRFDGTTANAWKIVSSVIKKHTPAEAVKLQRELVDLRHRLSETEAAKVLYSSLMQGMASHKELLARLEKHARNNKDSQEEARIKIQIEEVNKQIDNSFNALKDLKIPIGRRIALFFSRGV
jgi:hypothetical protein